MFSRGMLRGWRSGWYGGRGGWHSERRAGGSGGVRSGGAGRPGQQPRPQRSITTAAAGGAGAAAGWVQMLAKGAWSGRGIGAALLGGGAATAAWRWREADEPAGPFESADIPWVCALANTPGIREMLIPGQMLRSHPVGQLISEDDHLFETMRRSEQVREFRCFYDPNARKFYSVVLLGRDVCGYPSTTHGGLTAAIVDETFGGLYTCLLTSGGLGATLPGLTARLELDYRRRIPAGAALLVEASLESVEGRKVWMCASVTDGSKTTYAAGRALFVAPGMGKHFAALRQWRDSLGRQLAGSTRTAAAVATSNTGGPTPAGGS